MKKLLIILGVLFSILVLAIIILPIIFEDDIRKAIDETLDDSLNAKVFYDTDQFDISLISNFPDLTVSLGDFGVAGVEEFSEDTLVSVQNFQVTVDLMSAIGGEQIKVEEILLNEPKIFVLVLENGKANYDIAKPSEPVAAEQAPQSTEVPEQPDNPDTNADTEDGGSSNLSIGIERWAITNGQLIYMDQAMNFYTSVLGLNHEGTGDFTLDIFDLSTKTTIDALSLGFEEVEYLSDKRLDAEITLNMNLPEMLFTFKENKISLNDFGIGADGFVSMPGDDIEMDVEVTGSEISIKSILSLIPGVYQEYLDGVSASGEINFNGVVKGTYNDSSMPQVAAQLDVVNGNIAYSEFNIPMEEININTSFDYPSSDLSQTSFAVNNFSMLVDGEKLSAYLKFKDLENYTWDFGFEGNADLEKITKIVPLEGMTLKGKINAGLKSAGQMSLVEAEKYDQLPTSGQLSIDEFYFESGDLPQGFGIAKANLTFDPSTIGLNQFEASSGRSDFSLKGNITNYIGFALNDELLRGSLSLNSSLLDLNEFMPESEESPEAEPEDTETEDEADQPDVAATETPADSAATEAIKVPENIDFTFASSIETIAITNLEMKNFEGRVLVRDGAIILDQNSFNMLDGTFELSGSYVTKDLEEPKYDFGFKVKDLSIAGAFSSFSTIQQYVPIAEQVTGKLSTDFNVNGLLGKDMMPLLDKINLAGLVNVAQASLSKGEFVSKLNTLTAFKAGATSQDSDEAISIKDVLIKTEIKDGHLFVEPFNLKVKGQEATIGGSNTLDGKLDYSMLIKDIPTGIVGNALNSAVSSLTGGSKLISDKIDIDLGIGGTYDDVKINLLSTSESGESSGAAEAFKQQISSKVDDEKAKAEAKLAKEKAEAEAKAKAAADSARVVLEAKKKAVQDSIDAAAAAAKKKAADEAKNKVKKLFKKKG